MTHEYSRRNSVTPIAIAFAMLTVCGAVMAQESGRGSVPGERRMPDGKRWTTSNLSAVTDGSYCYDDAPSNCGRYGRLYTWSAARDACVRLGRGWRLPTDDEWRSLARRYGGVMEESESGARGAYQALIEGGSSRFEALRGGNREADGTYSRLDAHGLYWTASENNRSTVWLYNFGRGGGMVSRHGGGDKRVAMSVRCIAD